MGFRTSDPTPRKHYNYVWYIRRSIDLDKRNAMIMPVTSCLGSGVLHFEILIPPMNSLPQN